MSRNSRRKRSKQLNAKKAVLAAKSKHSPETAVRYYLCRVRHAARCGSCGGQLRQGAEMVYRKAGQVKLCVPCADKLDFVTYATSAAWEAERQTIGAPKAQAAARRPQHEWEDRG